MSIATRIQAMEEHISDAYDSLSKFGVAAPSNKNIENIASLVNEIYDNTPKTDYASGTNLTLENTRVGKIDFKDADTIEKMGLGVTNQYITGYNLLNIYARHPAGYTETSNGVTFTYNYDGSITANGTATADINFFIASQGQLGDGVFNGTNYLSGCSGGSLTTFYLQFWVNTIGIYQQATTEVATNKTSGVNWNITIGIKSGITINKKFYPMICATSGKSFEMYTNNPSPNPSYPQDINVVKGNQNILVQNKNLIEEVFKGYNINGRGQFETGGTSLDFDVNIAQVQAGVTYTITPITNVIAYFDEKPTISSTSYNGQREIITATNTLTPTRSGYIAIRTATTNTAQLEKGTTVTSYVPHQENNYEISLGTIELCKIDAYQDYIYKNGKNWYIHKEIKKLILDGTEDWTTRSSSNVGQLYEMSVSGFYPTSSITMGYSNQYLAEINLTKDNTWRIISGNKIAIRNDTIGSLSNFKTSLSNNNLIIYYPPATPTDTQITDTTLISQLNAWYNAQSMDDTTYITVDGDLPMQLKLRTLKK